MSGTRETLNKLKVDNFKFNLENLRMLPFNVLLLAADLNQNIPGSVVLPCPDEWEDFLKESRVDPQKDAACSSDPPPNKEKAEPEMEKLSIAENEIKGDAESDAPPPCDGVKDVKHQEPEMNDPQQSDPLPPTAPETEHEQSNPLPPTAPKTEHEQSDTLPPASPETEDDRAPDTPEGPMSDVKGKQVVKVDVASLLSPSDEDDTPFPRGPLSDEPPSLPPSASDSLIQQQRLFGSLWKRQKAVCPEDEVAYMPNVWLFKNPGMSCLKQVERERIMRNLDPRTRRDVYDLYDKELRDDAEALLRGHKMAMDRRMWVEKEVWGEEVVWRQNEAEIFQKKFDYMVKSSAQKDPKYHERLRELAELLQKFESRDGASIKERFESSANELEELKNSLGEDGIGIELVNDKVELVEIPHNITNSKAKKANQKIKDVIKHLDQRIYEFEDRRGGILREVIVRNIKRRVVAGELSSDNLSRLIDELLLHDGRISRNSEIRQYFGLNDQDVNFDGLDLGVVTASAEEFKSVREIDLNRAKKRKNKRQRQKVNRAAKRTLPESPKSPPPPEPSVESEDDDSSTQIRTNRPDTPALDESTCTLVGDSSDTPPQECAPGGSPGDQPVPPVQPDSIPGFGLLNDSTDYAPDEAQLLKEAMAELDRLDEDGDPNADTIGQSNYQNVEGEYGGTQHLDRMPESRDEAKDPVDQSDPVDELKHLYGESGPSGEPVGNLDGQLEPKDEDQEPIDSERQAKMDEKMRKKVRKAARAAKRAEERAEEQRKVEMREARKREKKEQEKRMKMLPAIKALDTPTHAFSSGSARINPPKSNTEHCTLFGENAIEHMVKVSNNDGTQDQTKDSPPILKNFEAFEPGKDPPSNLKDSEAFEPAKEPPPNLDSVDVSEPANDPPSNIKDDEAFELAKESPLNLKDAESFEPTNDPPSSHENTEPSRPVDDLAPGTSSVPPAQPIPPSVGTPETSANLETISTSSRKRGNKKPKREKFKRGAPSSNRQKIPLPRQRMASYSSAVSGGRSNMAPSAPDRTVERPAGSRPKSPTDSICRYLGTRIGCNQGQKCKFSHDVGNSPQHQPPPQSSPSISDVDPRPHLPSPEPETNSAPVAGARDSGDRILTVGSAIHASVFLQVNAVWENFVVYLTIPYYHAFKE
ncbi:hypothetical protein BDD12DRAFT_984500 [Trichophaea hybrida]|nr:hypothetical protein BDD12DRAFT_984500 [Trichophaea hybrida]